MEFKKLNLDEMRKVYDEEVNKKKMTDEKYAQLVDEGVTKVRILPSNSNERQFFVKSGVHKVGEDYINCPKMAKNQRCPICDKVAQLYRSKEASDVELARSLKAKKKYYFNVVVRGEEDKGPRVLTTGVKLFDKIMGAIVDPEIGDITDPMTGFDFNISKKMKAEYWNYDDSNASRKQTKLSEVDTQAQEWINKQWNLDAEVSLLGYDELKTKLVDFLNPGATISSVENIVISKNTVPPAIGEAKAVATPVQPTHKTPEATKSDDDMADFASTLEKIKSELNN